MILQDNLIVAAHPIEINSVKNRTVLGDGKGNSAVAFNHLIGLSGK